jgi:hypothetical protein
MVLRRVLQPKTHKSKLKRLQRVPIYDTGPPPALKVHHVGIKGKKTWPDFPRVVGTEIQGVLSEYDRAQKAAKAAAKAAKKKAAQKKALAQTKLSAEPESNVSDPAPTTFTPGGSLSDLVAMLSS